MHWYKTTTTYLYLFWLFGCWSFHNSIRTSYLLNHLTCHFKWSFIKCAFDEWKRQTILLSTSTILVSPIYTVKTFHIVYNDVDVYGFSETRLLVCFPTFSDINFYLLKTMPLVQNGDIWTLLFSSYQFNVE